MVLPLTKNLVEKQDIFKFDEKTSRTNLTARISYLFFDWILDAQLTMMIYIHQMNCFKLQTKEQGALQLLKERN